MREILATIADTNFIIKLFSEGLEKNNDRLAVSAMEELLRRGDSDKIVYELDYAFDLDLMVKGSPLVALVGSSLFENAHEIDPILYHYGKGLRGGDFMGPTEWISTHADRFARVYCSNDVRHARPWAKQYIDEVRSKMDLTKKSNNRRRTFGIVDHLSDFIRNL